MTEPFAMRDPTAETEPAMRQPVAPPASLDGLTIGLLSIGKERSVEFLDAVEERLAARGLKVVRFAKPTHTKPAPRGVIQDLVERCDIVVEGLAD